MESRSEMAKNKTWINCEGLKWNTNLKKKIVKNNIFYEMKFCNMFFLENMNSSVNIWPI